MSTSLIRPLLGLMFAAFMGVRFYNHNKAMTEGGEFEYKEPNPVVLQTIRMVVGFGWLVSLGLYFFKPVLVEWASFPLPDAVRWAGLALGYLSVPLVWWTEFSLGKNFNTTLHLREDHTLVTAGPYRWVRHPMYTSLFMLTLALLLASANLLVGLPALGGLLVIVINRVGREEKVMQEQFGDDYRQYMQRTGRFLPRLMA